MGTSEVLYAGVRESPLDAAEAIAAVAPDCRSTSFGLSPARRPGDRPERLFVGTSSGNSRERSTRTKRTCQARGFGRTGRAVGDPLQGDPLEKPPHLSQETSWLWDRVIEHMETIVLA